jgi:hypothetical protein
VSGTRPFSVACEEERRSRTQRVIPRSRERQVSFSRAYGMLSNGREAVFPMPPRIDERSADVAVELPKPPLMCDLTPATMLFSPPAMEAQRAASSIVLFTPPLTDEFAPRAELLKPPVTDDPEPAAVLSAPHRTAE